VILFKTTRPPQNLSLKSLEFFNRLLEGRGGLSPWECLPSLLAESLRECSRHLGRWWVLLLGSSYLRKPEVFVVRSAEGSWFCAKYPWMEGQHIECSGSAAVALRFGMEKWLLTRQEIENVSRQINRMQRTLRFASRFHGEDHWRGVGESERCAELR
jgi:hypothetical protein